MGTAVITWQKSLDLFGYVMKNDQGIVYPPDGAFGGATENATENFQRDHFLPVTGKVDLFTYSAMIDKLDKMAAGQKNKIEGAINLLEGIG
jgi:peptidoglycan hydrolase-like protein with peptidoglycan-binding domain